MQSQSTTGPTASESRRKKNRPANELPFHKRKFVVEYDIRTHYGLSKTRIYQFAREGKLKTVTVGGRILFEVKSVLKLFGEAA